MNKSLNLIFDFINWVVIPLILFIVIFLTKKTAKDPDYIKDVKAINAGFWGGIILVAITLVYQIGGFIQNGFPHNPLFQGIDLALTFAISIIVFILFVSKKAVASHKTIGLAVLIITSDASYAIVSYLFIREANELIISATLGTAFGAMLHFASSPKSLRDFMERTKS